MASALESLVGSLLVQNSHSLFSMLLLNEIVGVEYLKRKKEQITHFAPDVVGELRTCNRRQVLGLLLVILLVDLKHLGRQARIIYQSGCQESFRATRVQRDNRPAVG